MNREEEIQIRAEQEYDWFGDTGDVKGAFISGAKWADEHPDKEKLKKEFIDKAVAFLQEDIIEDYNGLIYEGFLENFINKMEEQL